MIPDIELEVTETAIAKIFSVIESENMIPKDTLFRLKVTGQNSTEFDYQMGLDIRKNEIEHRYDNFFNLEKFDMVIDENSLEKVNGATIDYKTDLNNEGFVITNPNVPEITEIEQRITAHLDSTINPMIASHGGKIDVIRVEASVLYIEMKGGCQGCASSALTLTQGVENLVFDQYSEVYEVKDMTDHESGENPYYT